MEFVQAKNWKNVLWMGHGGPGDLIVHVPEHVAVASKVQPDCVIGLSRWCLFFKKLNICVM